MKEVKDERKERRKELQNLQRLVKRLDAENEERKAENEERKAAIMMGQGAYTFAALLQGFTFKVRCHTSDPMHQCM